MRVLFGGKWRGKMGRAGSDAIYRTRRAVKVVTGSLNRMPQSTGESIESKTGSHGQSSSRIRPCLARGAKGAESGSKRRQIRRPFHSDVQILRIVHLTGARLMGVCLMGVYGRAPHGCVSHRRALL